MMRKNIAGMGHGTYVSAGFFCLLLFSVNIYIILTIIDHLLYTAHISGLMVSIQASLSVEQVVP